MDAQERPLLKIHVRAMNRPIFCVTKNRARKVVEGVLGISAPHDGVLLRGGGEVEEVNGISKILGANLLLGRGLGRRVRGNRLPVHAGMSKRAPAPGLL